MKRAICGISKGISARKWKPGSGLTRRRYQFFGRPLKASWQPRPEIPARQRAPPLNREILKLHINAGKRTKMRPVDIVGTLCNLEGMTPEDIGVINILDISTFVEILKNKGEKVLKQLQTRAIKGRIRKVSRVET